MLVKLLKELNDKGVEVTYSKGKLKYSGPEQNITPELIQKLKDNKTSLIKYLWPSENSNLIPINTEGNKTPLILVHGNNAVNILSNYFEGERPIYNFLDIGSNGEKISSKNIYEMAKLYIDQLIELAPKGPYIFCGFSFGGLLAFKMAELLQDKGNNLVPCIVMFDTNTPQTKYVNKINKAIYKIKKNKGKFFINSIAKRLEKLKFYIILLLHINKPFPAKYRRKYITYIYGKLARNYTPTKIDTNLLIFRSNDNLAIDPFLGWNSLVNNTEIVKLEGDHMGILYLDDNYKIISEEINNLLKKLNM